MRIVEFSATDTSLLAKVEALRATVWNARTQLNLFPDGRWRDSHDEHAIHWAILGKQDQLIASARLCAHEKCEDFPDSEDLVHLIHSLSVTSPIGMMNRLVVHPAHQGQGLALKLDTMRLNKASEIGCRSIMLEVPSYRKRAIESLDFQLVGKAIDTSSIQLSKTEFFLYTKDLRLQPAC
jgi:GNAT superfamily N-acetyltransferase